MKKTTFFLFGFVIATAVAAIVFMSSIDGSDVPSYDLSNYTAPALTSGEDSAHPEDLPFPEHRGSGKSQSVTVIDAAERSADGDPTHQEVESLLVSSDARNELLALDLMYDFDDEEVVPFLHLAMGSDTDQVRAAVVQLAAKVKDEEVSAEILDQAISDHAPFVGHAVLDEVENQPTKVREQVFRSALKLAPAEIGGAVVAELTVNSDYAAVDLMIEGLDSTVEATRNEASFALESIFEEQLSNASEAQGW